MTLIIGIRCKEGVVLGADGAATLTDSTMQPTIQLPVKKKLQVRSGQVIVGVSGNVGLSQAFTEAIGQAWAKKEFSGKNAAQGSQVLRQLIWKSLHPEVLIAQEAAKAFGQSAIQNILTATAVAIVLEDKPCLFQFDHQGVPCEATEDLPMVALGSGQRIADPFLAFLRRIFWPNGLPTLAQGTLATVWSIQHAITTNPGGVGGGIQIATLRRDAKTWVASELKEEEWGEHRQDMTDAERVLANFRQYLSASTTPPPSPEAVTATSSSK